MKMLVIKCGGSTVDVLPSSFFTEIVKLKSNGIHPIIVHGGGPAITELLHTLDVETVFVNGLRKTTVPVLDVVEMVLSGNVNKLIVRHIIKAGGIALGLSGVDGMLLKAKPLENSEELGLVGEIFEVNKNLLLTLINEGIIPVISPVAVDKQGQHYNTNADLAAAAIAKHFQAPLCMVSDVDGVLLNGNVIPTISDLEVTKLIEEQHITSGMIPKVKAAISCLKSGVEKVGIVNGSKANLVHKFATGEAVAGTTFYIEEVLKQHV
ncbi:acetylglutamate kinase [Sutcliffiella rhizosphaerae]|uniref:Acetylglutamate kinase n=1 Tax=Sutcliffiella rhizosphaerae TaxID=2880967 RepID=A0ABM8YP30_9BACI|nr:acetylglutamate kinase [Sutcliffiella rhizosphaerae]CAG9621659.1 Acetylglutamate kinase [Sutcliffiella rhizosphaerae]